MNRIPLTTKILLGINGILFLLTELQLPGLDRLWEILPLFYPRNRHFGVWQYVTSMFVHGNLTHLVFNMVGLFSFGSVLERVWGPKRFLLFYFAAGIGAGLVHNGVNMLEARGLRAELMAQGVPADTLDQVDQAGSPREFALRIGMDAPEAFREMDPETLIGLFRIHHVPVVGASGAIYGILTAFGLLFPNAKLQLIFLPVPLPAKFFIPGLLLLDLFSGVTGFSVFGGGIAHFAHLGGALIGGLLMLVWRRQLSLPQMDFL